MTETEATLDTLRRTLEGYLAAVPRQKESNPPDILAFFRRLDELEALLDDTVHPQLRHYMHQKSYRKAYLFLSDRDEENTRGNCGR